MSDIPSFLDAPLENEEPPVPRETPPPEELDALAPEAPPSPRDPETEARRAGYSWPEINNHIATATAEALAYGYTPDEIDQHLGRPDPKPLQDRLSASMAMDAAADPLGFIEPPSSPVTLTAADEMAAQRIAAHADQPAPAVDPFMEDDNKPSEHLSRLDTPDMRVAYAEALANGEVPSEAEFAYRAAAALWNATFQAAPVDAPTQERAAIDLQNSIVRAGRAFAEGLPSPQELTDAAIAIDRMAGFALPGFVTKRNLADAWAATGLSFYDLAKLAGTDPNVLQQLTEPKPVPPPSNPAYSIARTAEAMFYGGKTPFDMPVTPTTKAAMEAYERYPGILTAGARVLATGAEGVARTVSGVLSGMLAGSSQIIDEVLGDREFMGHFVHAGAPEETGRKAAAQAADLMALLFHQQVSGGAPGLRGTPTRVRDAEGNLVSPRAETAPMAPREAARIVDQVFGDAQKILDAPTEVVDPLKPAGETSSTVPAREAFVPDEALHTEAEATSKLPDAERDAAIAKARAPTEEQPLTLYHGSRADISGDLQAGTRGGMGPGVFLTPSEEQAANFGTVRRVQVNIQPDEFLDWQRPLDEQPKAKALADTLDSEEPPSNGRDLWSDLRGRYGEAGAVKALEDAGIKGNQFGDERLVFDPANLKLEPTASPAEVKELAKGYDAADAVWAHFHNLMIDQAGGVPMSFFRTPEKAAFLAEKRAGREMSQALIRQFRGDADRFIAANSAKLDEYRATVNRHIPAYEALLRQIEKLGPGNANLLDGNPIHEMLRFIEGRSLGATLATTSPLYAVADMIRHVNNNMRSQIEMTLPDMKSFREDYYRHLWKPNVKNEGILNGMYRTLPPEAERAYGVNVQGSSASLQKRTIPTITEGIEAGLIPKIANPIDNTMHYIAGMAYHLASKEIINSAIDAGYIKFKDVPTGWVALNGAGATRLFASPANLAIRTAEADARRALADALAPHNAKIDGLRADLASLQARAGPGVNTPGIAYARRQIADALTERRLATETERTAVREATAAMDKATTAGMQRAMAPPGFANSYNYWVGKGFYGMPIAGPWVSRIQYFANAMTGYMLGLPTYHLMAIAQESAISTLANALGAMSRGQIGQGLYGIGMGVTVVPDLVRQTLRGQSLYKRWLDLDDKSEAMQLFVDAGGRMGPRQEIYRYGKSRSIFKSLSEGSLGIELRNDARDILGAPGEAPGVRLAMIGPRLVGIAGRELGRVLNTITDPLFDRMIPNVKAAATFDALESWLKANVNNSAVTPAVKQAMARRIINSVDDRLGEMNQSNLFWPNAVKQALNLSTVSLGWEYGSLRAAGIAGSRVDTRFTTDRLRWLISLPLINGIMGSVYQRLSAGTWPTTFGETQNPNIRGQHMAIPGYAGKDFMQWAKLGAIYTREGVIPGMQATGKYLFTDRGNGLKMFLQEVLFGEDTIGHKISALPREALLWPLNMDSVYFHVPIEWARNMSQFLRHIDPIQVQSIMQAKTTDQLSVYERLMGIKSVNQWVEDMMTGTDKFFTGRETQQKLAERQEAQRYNRENAQLVYPGAAATVPSDPRSRAGGGGRAATGGAGGAGYNPVASAAAAQPGRETSFQGEGAGYQGTGQPGRVSAYQPRGASRVGRSARAAAPLLPRATRSPCAGHPPR